MMISLKKVLLASLFGGLALGVALPVSAADNPATPEAPPKARTPRGMPFKGKIKAVDKAAKTITLDREKSNVLFVTSQSKLTKAGKPAVFDDATVGEEVGGLAREKDGKLEIVSLRIGPKPTEEAKPEPKPKKEKEKAPEAK